MRRPNGTPVFVAIIAVNIALIFLAAAFFKGQISGVMIPIVLGLIGAGVLAFVILAMVTSRGGDILKSILGLIVGAAIVYGAFLFKQHSDAQVMERHYAILITAMDERDVKFAECWFDSSTELKQFLKRNDESWYMGKDGVRGHREMLDYYHTVKAEEKEEKKVLIVRRNLGSAPAQPEQGQLIAFVDEYRKGNMAIESNPVYNVNPVKGERTDEGLPE